MGRRVRPGAVLELRAETRVVVATLPGHEGPGGVLTTAAHQRTLPEDDHRSRAIIEQMRVDEAEHGEAALDLGGSPFPAPVRALMAASAKLMTETTYRL